MLVNSLTATVGFHADHLEDLAPPAHEFSEVAPFWLREGPHLRSHALSKKGDHLGVERIGLGEAAHGPGKGADLARVDDAERQPGAGEGRRDGCFKAARRLQDDKGDGQIAEAAGEAVQPLCVSRDAEGLTRRSEMDVEAIFGHVDADEDGGRFVHDPTLRMRAQAQAAVRVRDCEGGSRTKLCPGLTSPRRTRADPHLQPRRLRSGEQLRHTRRSVERYSIVKRA